MATVKQQKALDILVENGGNVSQAMIAAGYSPATAHTPQKLTESKAFKEIFGSIITDEDLAQKHRELLNSTKIEHMVFPLGPKDADHPFLSGARPNNDETSDDDNDPEAAMPEEHKERTNLSDSEIVDMLAEVNCKVRRIVHGETARHVYFWAADNKARKDALDMGYKLRGAYAPEKHVSVTATIDLNAPVDDQVALAKEYEEKLRERMLNGNTTGTIVDPRVASGEQDQEREGGTD